MDEYDDLQEEFFGPRLEKVLQVGREEWSKKEVRRPYMLQRPQQ